MDTIVEFNAGRVSYDVDTKLATPLPGKGKFVLKHSSEDNTLMCCVWLPRDNCKDTPGEELLLIPGDVTFSHAKDCKTGRVLQMRYNSSGERHFFWLQAHSPEKASLTKEDQKLIDKLNELLSVSEAEDSELENEISMTYDTAQEIIDDNGTDPTQPDVFRGSAPSPLDAQPSSGQNDAATSTNENNETATPNAANTNANAPETPLASVFDLLSRKSHVENVGEDDLQRLLSHTSNLASNRAELSEVVSSPYFTQALESLVQALAESPALASEMGLPRPPRSMQDLLEMLRNL